MPVIPEPCASCGARCCDRFAVGVTLSDARRLADAGYSLSEILSHQPHEGGKFPLLLVEGRPSLLCLKRKANERCIFLTRERACAAYGDRPMTCRAYPFELKNGRLAIKEGVVCTGTYALDADFEKAVFALLRQQAAELEEFKAFASAWNARGGGGFEELLAVLR
ncbi:MAG: YkgJ family cysteine cluster protein [Candidatus Micrarchaeia archaeon]